MGAGLGVIALVVVLFLSLLPAPRRSVILSAREIALVAGRKAFARLGGPPIGAMGTIRRHSLWVLDGDGLFISNDNRLSWTKTTPPSAGDPLADLLSIDFLDPGHGWVVASREQGVQVDRTVDGGSTWQAASLPTSLFPRGWNRADVSFVNDQDGWLTVQPYIPKGKPTTSVLFASTNGGARWSVVGVNAPVSNISFETAQVGWGISPDGAKLFGTTDGGRSWHQVDLPSPSTATNASGAWQTVTIPVFSGDYGSLLAAAATGNAVVETTTDGGTIWSLHKTPFVAEPVYPTSATSGSAPSCAGCVLPTEEPFAVVSPNVFVYWADGELFTTADGGRTWKSIQPNLSFPSLGTSAIGTGGQEVIASADPLQFSSAANGWAVATVNGQSLLLMTQDSGHHFVAISPPTAPLPGAAR